MKQFLYLLLAGAIALCACSRGPEGSDPRVEKLLRKMTLEEKVGQTVLFTSDWSVTGPSMREGYIDDILRQHLQRLHGRLHPQAPGNRG